MSETEDRKFKKSHPEPKEGWTKDDRASRCINCGHGKDNTGAIIGTLLSMITISVYHKGDVNIPVAHASICRRCHRIYGLTLRLHPETLRQVAADMGITRDNIMACLRASKNATLFELEELQTGKMKEVELPATVRELMAKRSHGASARDAQEARTGVYNPDAFIEQKEQAALPF